jgi:hypothetical protein
VPTRKARLSKQEMVKYLACARDLREAGLIAQTPPEWKGNSGPLQIQVAPPPYSVVCVLANGIAYYAIWVRLLSRSAVTLQDCQICALWDDQIILASFDGQKQLVDFGGQLYQQKDILNRRLESGLRVGCSQVVEGWILALGLRPIATDYRTFFTLCGELTFWDLLGREFQADINFSALRAPQQPKPCESHGDGLYGPDNQPPELSVAEASQLRYLKMVRQEKEAAQERADGIADPGAIASANAAESAEMHLKLAKQLADFVGRADLDDTPTE